MAEAAGGEVRAVGAVLWRRSDRGIEVALIHRPRYDDWSFPKGKIKRGEHVLEAAVREVTEETGIRPLLGRPLPTARYESGGRPKRVDYWAARPAPGSDPVSSGWFRANDEVDDLRWLPLFQARARLSYPRDAQMLDEFAAGPADTVPFAFLRHASAGSRQDWHGDDQERPLDAEGTADAELLARLLPCFGFRRVISSPAERCLATVQPFAEVAHTTVAVEPAFTAGPGGYLPDGDGGVADAGVAAVPDGTAAAEVAAVVAARMPAVICAHRENLPSLLTTACAALGAAPPDASPLPFAGFWVLHAAHGLLAAAERHQPAEP